MQSCNKENTIVSSKHQNHHADFISCKINHRHALIVLDIFFSFYKLAHLFLLHIKYELLLRLF